MAGDRVEKTIAKVRRGALPTPAQHTRLVGTGDGMPCDGCGEPITSLEVRISVSTGMALDWWFHESCYNAWLTSNR
jgi:hypothetical protein